MECLLCKGRGSFLVFKKDNKFNALLGGSDYHVHEQCPRCDGTGKEKYVNQRIRISTLMTSYGESYKYFKSKNTNPAHEEIIEYLK